jgi:hypothetical protein
MFINLFALLYFFHMSRTSCTENPSAAIWGARERGIFSSIKKFKT